MNCDSRYIRKENKVICYRQNFVYAYKYMDEVIELLEETLGSLDGPIQYEAL